MFAFFSKLKGNRFLFAVLVLCVAVFIGCSSNLDDEADHTADLPDGLIGIWASAHDRYIIRANNTFEYDAGWDASFTGVIVSVSNFSSDSGVIIVRYTSPPTHNVWESDDPFYVSGHDYTGVYFRNLTSTTVQLANVINLSDWSSVDTRSRREAELKFTRDGANVFVGHWGTYTLQN